MKVVGTRGVFTRKMNEAADCISRVVLGTTYAEATMVEAQSAAEAAAIRGGNRTQHATRLRSPVAAENTTQADALAKPGDKASTMHAQGSYWSWFGGQPEERAAASTTALRTGSVQGVRNDTEIQLLLFKGANT